MNVIMKLKSKPGSLIGLFVFVSMILAACTAAVQTSQPTQVSTPTSTQPASSSGEATINVATDSTLGQILVDGKGMTLYMFTVDDPVFWKGGRIKSGVQFIPAGQHYKHRWYETMTVEKMTEHQDNWQLVEEVRQQKSTALIRCGDTWKHIA